MTCSRALCDRLANLRAEFDHRLVHLGFDLFLEHDLAAFENFLDVRPQLARLRIDDREFLFDAESKVCSFGLVHGAQISLKPKARHPDSAQILTSNVESPLPVDR